MTVTAKSPWVQGAASRARLGAAPAWRALAVRSPFRVYAEFGTTATNAYHGSSRIHSACRAAINATPGDELHCLPGGIFLVRPARGVAEVKLAPSKSSPFEKSYGAPTEREIVEALVRRGAASPLDLPPLAVDYGKVRRVLSASRLPDLHLALVEIEPSPERIEFERRFLEAWEALADAEASIVMRDHDAYAPTVRAEIRLAGTAREARPDAILAWAYGQDRLWLETWSEGSGKAGRREIGWPDLPAALLPPAGAPTPA